VRHQDLYEIKSSVILQPGPAALTDGSAKLQEIIQRWAARKWWAEPHGIGGGRLYGAGGQDQGGWRCTGAGRL